MIEIPQKILNIINHNNVTLNPPLSSTHFQSRRTIAGEIKIPSTGIRSPLNTTDKMKKKRKKLGKTFFFLCSISSKIMNTEKHSYNFSSLQLPLS